MNLYEKMLNITNEMSTVNKNLIVGEGKSQYKAVGEADVLKAVKELEKKYKIYSYPSARRIVESQILTTKKIYENFGKDSKETTESTKQFLRIETEYTFINIDDPDESLTITTYVDGIDSKDKAPRKSDDLFR